MAAFVYAFILLLEYIFDTKIHATDRMKELYGLPQLGMISMTNWKITYALSWRLRGFKKRFIG